VGQPDVIVIGAGLAGLATAARLASRRRVLVLDQAGAPGAEATAQNAGLVRRMVEDPYERALALRASAWFAAPGWDDPAPSRPTGAVLALADEPWHLNDAAAWLVARGVRVERSDRPAELAPALAGAPVVAAFWMPDERVADPRAMVAGWLRALRRDGAEVRCGVRVAGLRVAGGRVEGVETDRGPISAPDVVLAAGAWSAALAGSVGLERPLFPLRRTLLRTAPHALSRPDHPWVWLDDVGLYVRTDEDGWLVCPCDELPEPAPAGPGSRGTPPDPIVALAEDKLRRYLPALSGVTWRAGWSGLRTFAPDRRPLLGPDPALPGLHWCAGLGGSGVTCAPAAGEAAAAWLLGEEVPWLRASAVSPGREPLRRWPIRPDGDLRNTSLIDGRRL
jgi:D-arginine dehydrogenase